MKTRTEIAAEAQLMETQARSAWQQSPPSPGAPPSVLTVFSFPERILALEPSGYRSEVYAHRQLRRIDAELRCGGPRYVLREEHRFTDAKGRLLVPSATRIHLSTDQATDALQVGYSLADADALCLKLMSVASRLADSPELTRSDVASEVERITDGLDLSPSARLRTRADAVALFQGKMVPFEFIHLAVGRQRRFDQKSIQAHGKGIDLD